VFLGHFAVGLAAKTLAPRTSLGALLLAAQFIDLLWPTFLLLGIESVRIDPGNTVVTPLDFEHYPWSHSLAAVLGWSVFVGVVTFVFQRDRKQSLVLGLLVLSHWLLDVVVHRPDLPLWPGGTLIGLGLWQSLTATVVIEVGLLAAGAVLYERATRARDTTGRWSWWLFLATLTAIYASNVVGPPPPDVTAIAWVGQAQWLLLAWAWWFDRHRMQVSR